MDSIEFRRRRRVIEKTQSDAAKVIGLHSTMIVHFEKNRCLLRPDQLWRLKEWLTHEEAKLGIGTSARGELSNGQG